jgi:septal ring factor EnvC (AmiA/AmiB activator)
MDKHIEMSYCSFEAFKVLAKNYLDITEHERFGDVRRLLEETQMSPADVAENLMPMSKKKKRDTDACLEALVEALSKAKEDAAAAAAKAREEAEAKEKAEAEAKAAMEKAAKEAKGEDDKEKDETTSESTEAKMSNGEAKESEDATN